MITTAHVSAQMVITELVTPVRVVIPHAPNAILRRTALSATILPTRLRTEDNAYATMGTMVLLLPAIPA